MAGGDVAAPGRRRWRRRAWLLTSADPANAPDGTIGVDVAVVELDVADHEEVRAVVEELRSLVEERGVVLVPLDDRPAAPAEAPRRAVDRLAADQHGGVEAPGGEQVGGERRRRGLAVGAGDGDGAAVGAELPNAAACEVYGRLAREHRLTSGLSAGRC
jgi:hypothetical protein